MADIAEELAVIRTGIYGKDIREALGDAIEKVNLEGGGGGGGATVEFLRDIGGWVAKSDVEKDADIIYFFEYRNLIIYKRILYGGPIRCVDRTEYDSLRVQLMVTGGALDRGSIGWVIEDTGTIVVGNTTYLDPDYKKTYTMTESEYAAAQEAGTLNPSAVYLTFPDPEPPTSEETTEGE